MEKHNVLSELESCQDIYRNYLKKTQHFPVASDGTFPPADRKEWIAAKRAAKFYSKKIGRELKKARQAIAQLTPAHYKYARAEATVNMLEMRLEFALAVQNAIEVAKTAQTPYAEKELELAKENIFKSIAPEMLKANNTNVATTTNPLGSRSGSFHSSPNRNPTLTATAPAVPSSTNKPSHTIPVTVEPRKPNKLGLENSSGEDSIPTDPTSTDEIPKPITDADFEFDNLYSNNNSRNYTEAEINDLVKQANGEDSPNTREARPTNPSVPSMNNPLRDKVKSFRQDPKPSVPAQQTSGGQLANKIYSSETKSPNALNRSMINMKAEEEKEKAEAAAQKAATESKAHELSPEKDKDKKGKNPFKSFGKTIGRMFNLAPATPTSSAAPTTPKAVTSPTQKNVISPANRNTTTSPRGPTYYNLGASSDEFDTRTSVVTNPRTTTNNQQTVNHIINETSSFAEARRVAKVQGKAPVPATTKETAMNKVNEHAPTKLQPKSAELSDELLLSHQAPKRVPAGGYQPQFQQSASSSPRPQSAPHSPSANSAAAAYALYSQQQQKKPTTSSEDDRQQQALLYAQQRKQQQQQQQQLRQQPQSPPLQQVYQSPEATPSKGSIEQLRIDRENHEKLMKIADDMISAAKLTENRYNTTPQYWTKVNEAWEECVVYCEKQFDHSVDRFKTDWNRKLTLVIKEKHRWNDKMKRLQEYDYISQNNHATTTTTASSNPNLSNDYSVRSNGSKTSSLGGKSKSMYETSSASMTSSNGGGAIAYRPPGDANKLEKLQDKLQRNKVKSLLEKAIIVTNSAKYELSKRAINEARQAWQDVINAYEQSAQLATESFKDWWNQEVLNVKKQRDDHLGLLVEKTPISMQSMYNMDTNANTTTPETTKPSSKRGVRFDEEVGSPNLSTGSNGSKNSTATFEDSNHRSDSVNFHRVRVG